MTRIPYADLRAEFERVLLKHGLRADRAKLCARLFADASCDGVSSHGLNRFPSFINHILTGTVRVDAEPEFVEKVGVAERWDGRAGPGPLNAWFAMDRAIALARENAIGCVALRNTNHWMRPGNYGWQAADAGCIGICWTNTTFIMPPWGAKEPKVGNNPLVIAVPRPDGHVVLDMALAQFSNGRLHLYIAKNEPLPVEGGYDSDGRLTRDARAIAESRRPLPIGCWKGAGLALMLDLVGALLTGGLASHQLSKLPGEQGVSQVFIAFDVRQFSPQAAAQVADDIIAAFHTAAPLNEDERVLYPGERALMARKENQQLGVPVDPELWQQVQQM